MPDEPDERIHPKRTLVPADKGGIQEGSQRVDARNAITARTSQTKA
jgi:hypothetical protein